MKLIVEKHLNKICYTKPIFSYMKGLSFQESEFNRLKKEYKIHVVVWMVFILYEALMVGFISGVYGKFWNYAIHYSINICLFYINAHFVLPRAFSYPGRAGYRLPVFLVALIICYVLFVFCIDSLLVKYTDILEMSSLNFEWAFWQRTVWRGIYFTGFSTGYYYLITYLHQQKRVSDLENQNLKSEIAHERTQRELAKAQNDYLKAQINPHFLFNTLSFIHSHTQKSEPRVAETILSLSEIMRYALKNESQDEEAVLIDEINQVENLIRLHELRSDTPLMIELQLKGDLSEIEIIPLILTTLAENMFKHGVLSDPKFPAMFRVELTSTHLLILTKNLVNPYKHTVSLNLGLQNIRKRLELRYRDQFSFNHHTDKDNYYHSQITINNIYAS